MAARSDRTLRTTCDQVVAQARAVQEAHPPQRVLVRLVTLADDLLAALDQPTNARHQSWSSLLSHRHAGRHQLARLDQELAQSTAPRLLERVADARWGEVASTLGGPLPVSVGNHFGNSHLVDYLRATLLELCVMAEPLGCLEPGALRTCVRALSQGIGERFPGQTIEVRIPPASAVQLGAFGEGPTHTRGTPPNVVETDEVTWLQLGTGLVTLEQALTEARATASGSHHQALARMLPVLDLRHLA